MANRSRSPLVFALVVALLGAGAAFYWFAGRHEGGDKTATVAPTVTQAAPTPAKAQPDEDRSAIPEAPSRSVEMRNTTTVAWPVHLDLMLMRDANLPTEPGVPALGSGRTAQLKGTVVGRDGNGVKATVAFVLGLNEGRVLECNEQGQYGATDLYPGMSIVRVDGPNIVGSTREVLLRQGSEQLLNVTYGFAGSCSGTVYEFPDNKPLADVQVELDGQHTITNEAGEFDFPQMTSGARLLLILKKKGYASYRETIGVAGDRPVPRDHFKFIMRPAASLKLSVAPSAGAPGDALVYVYNAVALGGRGELLGQRGYPWHLINPLRIAPGRSALIDDLPEGEVEVRGFLAGAVASPPSAKVMVRTGATEDVVLRFQNAPQLAGKVVGPKGLPLENATVTLEAPDRVAALLNHMSQGSYFVESEVMPFFSPSVQTTQTGFDGRFLLTAWDNVAPTRYLSAESADGKLYGIRIVKATDKDVELKLEPREPEMATLIVDFPGRIQGLPVEFTINGVPFPELLVPSDEPLRLADLPAGTWRIKVSWNGQPVLKNPLEIKVQKETKTSIDLPSGAIQGQDEETLKRAGRM